MHKEYIEELVKCLHMTEFNVNGRKAAGYDEGFEELVNIFLQARTGGKQVFFIGNGGSAAIASHMTADFMKNGGMRTYSLYDTAMLTCMGNDYGYANIFAMPLARLGKNGDLLVAISSSGESPNIIYALDAADELRMRTVTLTGFHPGNKTRSKGNVNVYAPSGRYGIVESVHTIILQQAVDTISSLGQQLPEQKRDD